ncbi:hypothetical protein ASZ78_012292 [Callipepla squamata]|uniref:WD repeat and HMG-box DNA-binding protein 1 n=1 Tax=Callipepla squamata TaxID=9009 RepID=A0A226MEQ3_CALSU|nr:hypothetical protein ASZ78_012292 [Callipepla squamata]
MELGKKKKQVLHGDPLSLTKKSYLVWVGFSAEDEYYSYSSSVTVECFQFAVGQRLGKNHPFVLELPMQEQYWRSVVFHNYVDYLSKNGYELDENAQSQPVKEQQELLMKLFALSCKLERESRCVELADLMTQNVVNLAIKYASRSRRLNLAQRLSEMAVEKASELATALGDEEEEEDFRTHLNAGACVGCTQIFTYLFFLSYCIAVIASSSQGRVNPFKVSATKKDPVVPSANVLDTMSKYSKKLSSSRAVNKESPPVIKPLIPKPKSKQLLQASAASFFQVRTPSSSEKRVGEREEKAGNEPSGVQASAQDSTENKRPKTGFQMWLEENRANILTDNPGLNEAEVIKEGMSRFRLLSSEERIVWSEKAKGGTVNDVTEDKKRKRPTAAEDEVKKDEEQKSEDSNLSKKKKPLDQSTNVRLSSFAFKQS